MDDRDLPSGPLPIQSPAPAALPSPESLSHPEEILDVILEPRERGRLYEYLARLREVTSIHPTELIHRRPGWVLTTHAHASAVLSNRALISDAQNAESIAIGLRVRHPVFGLGTVAQVIGSGPGQKLRIRFDRAGLKTVMVRFANLDLG